MANDPKTPLKPGDIITLREAAQILNKHKSTIHDWIRDKRFPPYCQPFTYHDEGHGGFMFMRSEVERFAMERRAKGLTGVKGAK